MSDKEKEADKDAYLRDGYLKKYDYKEAWAISFKNASKEDREAVRKLPNFDAQTFFEITGIDYYLK